MADDEKQLQSECPTAKLSSQGAHHAASVDPDTAVATPQRVPIMSTHPISRHRSSAALATARTPTLASFDQLRYDRSVVAEILRQNVPKWISPAPPFPKNFDITEFENPKRAKNTLSDVTEHIENDSISFGLEDDTHGEDVRSGAQTIAEMMGSSDNPAYAESMHHASAYVEPFDTGNSMKCKPSFEHFATGQDTDSDAQRARPERLPSQISSSYLAHTQASKARQTEKVELASSRSSSHGTLREPASRMISTQRSASATSHRDRGRRSSSRRYRADDDIEPASNSTSKPSPNVSTPSGSTCSVDINDQSQEPKEEAHMVIRWLTESPSGSTSVNNEKSDPEHIGTSLQDELREYQEHEETYEIEQEASRDDRCHSNKHAAQEEPSEKSSAAHFQHLSIPAVKKNHNETSQPDLRVLEDRIAELSRELENNSADLYAESRYAEQAEDHLRSCEEDFDRLRQDIEELTNAIKRSSQNNKTPDKNALRSLMQDSGFSDEMKALHASLFTLIGRLKGSMQSISLKNDEIQQQLTNKEYGLSIAANMSIMPPVEKSAWDKDTWKQAYKDMRRRKEQAEERFESFKKTAEEKYQPDLERKNRELQIDLTRTQDERDKLREQVAKYRGRAKHWESEYNTSEIEREKRTAGFEDIIKQQQDEMLLYVKEYHDKVHDSEHWEIPGLQKRIRVLECDLQTTNELFSTTKTEKARLEDEITKLINTNTRFERDIKRLGKAFVMGGNILLPSTPDFDPFDSLSDGSSSLSAHPLTSPRKVPYHSPYIPRCYRPNEIDKREGILQQLRMAQQQRRESDKAEMAIMEKIRKWRMEELYPPVKNGWKELLKTSEWQRWDGEEWLETMASAKDKEQVEKWKRRQEEELEKKKSNVPPCVPRRPA